MFLVSWLTVCASWERIGASSASLTRIDWKPPSCSNTTCSFWGTCILYTYMHMYTCTMYACPPKAAQFIEPKITDCIACLTLFIMYVPWSLHVNTTYVHVDTYFFRADHWVALVCQWVECQEVQLTHLHVHVVECFDCHLICLAWVTAHVHVHALYINLRQYMYVHSMNTYMPCIYMYIYMYM